MLAEKIRVLVVDDSYFMRQAIVKLLTTSDIEVIDTAKNGKEAIEKVLALKPDIVTMDIEMPVMNGIEALSEIMKVYPVPVLMISTMTTEGADATIEALSIGAVDFVAKRFAFTEMDNLRDEIVQKVITISQSSGLKKSLIRRRLLQQQAKLSGNHEGGEKIDISDIKYIHTSEEPAEAKPVITQSGRHRPNGHEIKAIGIGISTGGPSALQVLFACLPAEIPVPILVVQHMPPHFTASLARRLDSNSRLNIKEAVHGETVLPGCVYIAPGGMNMLINKRMRIELNERDEGEMFKPSVDILLASMVESFDKNCIGIIMTGMGNDGLRGLKYLNKAGGYIISQDVETSVVAGMPRSVIDAGIVDEIRPLSELSSVVSSIFGLKAFESLKKIRKIV